MNVLLLGSGGREHALAWKLSQSPILENLYIAPGNAGTALCGCNVDIKETDFAALRDFVLLHHVGMVVVGPEVPLVKGIHDFFLEQPVLRNIRIIGPARAGAMLEGSKDFAKQFMLRHHIPTAAYRTFSRQTLPEGIEFLKQMQPPYVLKADGLAAGKGVIICNALAEAVDELTLMLQQQKFGEAGNKVVIEEYLQGIECSVFVVTDGLHYKILPAAKDYKRIGEADTGPNTGGMGTVSPPPFADEAFMRKVEDRILLPTIRGLAEEHIPYRGFIFFGLMNVSGDPYMIEYNVRMGDPEAESILPRISSDLLQLFCAITGNTLNAFKLEIDERVTATVMLVSGGYPGEYKKGIPVSGLERVKESLVFHAGTSRNADTSEIVTSGGRVLGITSLAFTLPEALEASYRSAREICFEGMYYRKDIGKDLI